MVWGLAVVLALVVVAGILYALKARAKLLSDLTRARRENETQGTNLDALRHEVKSLKNTLDKRPVPTRVKYSIITLGLPRTGKTSLTLKWANPLAVGKDRFGITQFDTYERLVSRIQAEQRLVEHVFEIRDWGGEHVVDAQTELVTLEIHGMLLVVDLAPENASEVSDERVRYQLEEFSPQVLKFLFNPHMVAKCQTVVLFINKSDLLPGRPDDVEKRAKQIFQKLINDLGAYSDRVNIQVMVGSANSGHNAHVLFSHFIEKILPASAHDKSLQQHIGGSERPPPLPAIEKGNGKPL